MATFDFLALKSNHLQLFYLRVAEVGLGKICLVLIGLFFLTSNVLWGDELESELIFISADSLIELNWGKNLEWIGPLITEAKTTATKVQSSVDLVFLVQLASDADAKVSIHTRPQVDIVVLNDLKNSINTWKLPRTKFGSFCFEFRFKVKGGTGGDKGNYTPDLIYPDTQFESDFQKLAPEAKYQKMIEYAQKEALPYFRVMMPSVDSKFDGVIQTGKLLEKMNLADALVLPIAVNNKNYWRGIMEMDRSDPSFYVLRAYLEVSEGKLEIANEIQQMASILFKDKKGHSGYLLQRLQFMCKAFMGDINKQIHKGVQLHDVRKFEEAMKVYDEVLKIYPHSASASYERWFSQNTGSKNAVPWDEIKSAIYEKDPLYTIAAGAKTGREGFEMGLRLRLRELFKSQDFSEDVLEYADIALDLKYYNIAAIYYWMIFTHIKYDEKTSERVLHRYLYCIEKLGATEWKSNFKGDFSQIFLEIEKELDTKMRSNPFFNKFEKEF